MTPRKKNESKEIEIKNDSWLEKEGELVVDVLETSKAIIIQAPIAGVKTENIEIIVEDDVLKIKGERRNPLKEKGEYLVSECYWGAFSKEIVLPVKINETKIEAAIEEGVLTIILPKKQVKAEKKIKIKETE